MNVFTPSINDSNNEIELIQEAINELKSKINNLKSHYKSLLQRSKKNYTEEVCTLLQKVIINYL